MTNGAITLELGHGPCILDPSRLDFATREELVEAYVENQEQPRRHQYVLAAAVGLAGGAEGLVDLPSHEVDPLPYGRAVYSQLRAAGAARVALIEAGSAVVLAVSQSLWPADAEVADRQDFSKAAASETPS